MSSITICCAHLHSNVTVWCVQVNFNRHAEAALTSVERWILLYSRSFCFVTLPSSCPSQRDKKEKYGQIAYTYLMNQILFDFVLADCYQKIGNRLRVCVCVRVCLNSFVIYYYFDSVYFRLDDFISWFIYRLLFRRIIFSSFTECVLNEWKIGSQVQASFVSSLQAILYIRLERVSQLNPVCVWIIRKRMLFSVVSLKFFVLAG